MPEDPWRNVGDEEKASWAVTVICEGDNAKKIRNTHINL